MTRKTLTCPLFRVQVHLFSTAEDYRKYTGDSMSANFAAQASTVENLRTGISSVCIAFLNTDEFTANTVTHECVHAAWRVLRLVGIEVTHDNNEPLAYVAGWMAEEVTKFMTKETEKNAEPSTLR